MIYFNRQLFPETEPLLLPAHRSLKFGDGLFETLRVREGRVLFFDDHWKRLNKGFKVLDAKVSATKEEIFEAIIELCKINRIEGGGRIRITFARSGGAGYLPAHTEWDFWIEASPLPQNDYRTQEPLSIGLLAQPLVSYNPLSGLKTLSALPYVYAASCAEKLGLDDVLILNAQGKLAESSKANLFWLQKQTLYTPALSGGCLDGVFRKQTIRTAVKLGYEVKEGLFAPQNILNAEAAFLTNVIQGAQPIGLLRWEGGEIKFPPSEICKKINLEVVRLNYFEVYVFREAEIKRLPQISHR